MFDFEKEYWNSRYRNGHNSGYGSYGEQLEKKLNWLKDLDIKSISEIGCGDMNFANHLLELYPRAAYNGQDISEFCIETNRKKYPGLNFVNEIDNLPVTDLLLCVDVLFHILKESDYEAVLKQIEAKWSNYLAVTAYERDEEKANHVRIRKFDYKRFGEPIIREVVEEDGQLYFYLFKKGPTREFIPFDRISACLITKDPVYPQAILDEVSKYPFEEVLILVNSDSPYNKHKLFEAAKYPYIYYQDDDAICPIKELRQLSHPEKLNIAMKPGHMEAYKNHRMTMGIGWGSIFPKTILKTLKKYTDKYGEDDIYKRETERVLTALNYNLQNRLSLPITDLPSAMAPDRLWQQPGHHESALLAEERCMSLVL